MIVNKLQLFVNYIEKGPLLSIDYGAKKIGLAITTPDRSLASPYDILTGLDDEKKIEKILALISEKKIVGIVIGLPINLDGSESDSSRMVRQFADKLVEKTDLPIYFQDERMTSKAASSALKMMGYKRKERDSMDDMVAANMILDSVLESIKRL